MTATAHDAERKDQMRDEAVAEVGIDAEKRVFVRPESGEFEHVYRAAMEVYWDRSLRRLFNPSPRDWTPSQWFQQIVAAVADEYGVTLRITSQTIWTDMPSSFRAAIEKAAQPKGG